MLGRFQPVHTGHENAIRRAYSLGDVTVGIYSVSQSVYNPFTPDEVDKMLHNSFPDLKTFVIEPTWNPYRFVNMLEKGAQTTSIYTRSRRAKVLMEMLGFSVIYEKKSGPNSSLIRNSIYDGSDGWKTWVNPLNVEIIESAARRPLAGPRVFSFGLMEDLYKHGIGF